MRLLLGLHTAPLSCACGLHGRSPVLGKPVPWQLSSSFVYLGGSHHHLQHEARRAVLTRGCCHPSRAPLCATLRRSVFGVVLRRDKVKGARLLANPGCYPTCSQLPLYPLLKQKLILPEDIIINACSGGAGPGLHRPKTGSQNCWLAV